jgi:hypothetical protein
MVRFYKWFSGLSRIISLMITSLRVTMQIEARTLNIAAALAPHDPRRHLDVKIT